MKNFILVMILMARGCKHHGAGILTRGLLDTSQHGGEAERELALAMHRGLSASGSLLLLKPAFERTHSTRPTLILSEELSP
jgi:hypothetical protein